MKDKLVHISIISIFVSLYFLVTTISMINSVAFFDLAHDGFMNWALAIGFELGAAASLAAIIILDKTNKTMVWSLFLLLTAFQMMANSYHAFVNLEEYMGWIELFGLEEEEPIIQKRILSVVSGAILPLVALGFIKSLTDYIKPEELEIEDIATEEVNTEVKEITTEIEIKKTSENLTEEIDNKPSENLEEVINESQEKDEIIPTIDNSVIDASRVSKATVHHVEKVPKEKNDSEIKSPGKQERTHVISTSNSYTNS